MALKQRQAILEEMRVLMGNTTVFTLTLETTLHSLNCHWGQQYTLYTVTVHYTTFFTLSQETTIHWCPAEGAVLVDPGGDRSGMVWLYGCMLSLHGESWAKYNLAEPIPLQVEHVAVEFVEPFRPSGPCLRTMKTFAQRCRVGTSYFTHSWETREGRERLPSR